MVVNGWGMGKGSLFHKHSSQPPIVFVLFESEASNIHQNLENQSAGG
jgi:hypothetical protein